jgi:hypothetical protein
MTEKQAWEAYENQRIDAVWVIPADFSQRLERGEHPNIEMHFTNYMDDRGKNHRIYSAEIMGLRARHHIAGAISMIMTGIIIFFTCGALSLVRYLPKKILWFAKLFPNGHAIDPMRDLILFHKWPTNWDQTVLILSIFAIGCLILSMIVTRRQLRRIG